MQTVYKPQSFITFVDSNPTKAVTFTKDSPFFTKVVDLYKKKDWAAIRDYFDIKNYIFKYSEGRVKVGDNFVLFDNKEVHNEISNRIIQFMKEGIDIVPLMKFLDNLMNNPIDFIKEDLFLFLENNKLPITEDGAFIAYKLVKDDYSPYYQYNASERYYLETEITLDREKCSTNREECSGAGLYFGRREYWNTQFDENEKYIGDGRMLIVKIFPQDVTSVPIGEYGRKGRCCKMLVVDEYEKVRPVMDSAVFGVREEVINELNDAAECLENDDFVEPEPRKNSPLRDSKGRFLSKKSPLRASNGRFMSRK